jgi:tRNA A-37 threonylcarbamoyl transferase component Bud32
MSGKVVIAVTAGASQGKTFAFDTHDIFLFGRKDDCHACLPDDQLVSRHHFVMEVNPPHACVRDLGSLHGTVINGVKYGGRQKHETPEQGARRQYPQVDLHDGDELQVGKTKLRVQVTVPQNVPKAVCCQRCGKEVTVEAGLGQDGDFLCAQCQQQIKDDPVALLLALFQQAKQPADADIRLADYHIQKKLGEGGMGVVYLVKHKKHGRLAALKVMLSKVAVNASARQEFLREIDNTRSLKHTHIVEFLGNGVEKSTFYFLVEYCQGGSLSNLMERRGGRLTLAEAGPIMLQALEGLAFAHKQGFVHRDLKPQNILLSGAEPRWTTKIADLGLAKSFINAGLSGMTMTGGGFSGSLLFMPREQVIDFKYVKPVSDVWSMGASFYNMLTGDFPRPIKPGQDPVDIILNGDIVPLCQRYPQIPKDLAAVIDHSLAQDPKDRYQTAGDMLKALAKVPK